MSSTFTYGYENRLTAISGGATANFVYDADAGALWERVKSTVGGVTTVYIGGVFEFIENGATDKMTTYYDGNAMRRSGYGIDDGVFYLLQDHLKSSSSFVNQSGATLANNYYYPYGGNRGSAFLDVTTKRFTGQYHESSLPGGEGLSYYNARGGMIRRWGALSGYLLGAIPSCRAHRAPGRDAFLVCWRNGVSWFPL